MEKIRKISLPLVIIGMLAIAVAIVLPVFNKEITTTTKYLYAAGAAVLLIGRIFNQYEGKSLRLKRLYRMETWSAIIFCVGAYFLFAPSAAMRDALAFTIAGALVQAYASLMIGRAKE